MRFFLYSHDGLGLGHLRRNLAIASALVDSAPEAQILIATSVEEAASLGLPSNVETLKLPGLRKLDNNRYSSRRMTLRSDEIFRLRSSLLSAAVESFQPDVILVDKHPFGAAGELGAALDCARAAGARAILGIRDILDDPITVRMEWSAWQERIPKVYERVLVYGCPSVFDPVEQYHFSPAIAERVTYCGYVVNQAQCACGAQPCRYGGATDGAEKALVLGTAGGGEDGFRLLEHFIHACSETRWQASAVSGPLLGEGYRKELQRLAGMRQVTVHAFIPCLASLFAKADALVCMGGYNTLLEGVSAGIPIVCVPRVSPRTEQLLRAEAFEKLGLIQMLHPAELTPEKLRVAIARALTHSRETLLRQAEGTLRFDGALQAAVQLVETALQPRYGTDSRHARRAFSRFRWQAAGKWLNM